MVLSGSIKQTLLLLLLFFIFDADALYVILRKYSDRASFQENPAVKAFKGGTPLSSIFTQELPAGMDEIPIIENLQWK